MVPLSPARRTWRATWATAPRAAGDKRALLKQNARSDLRVTFGVRCGAVDASARVTVGAVEDAAVEVWPETSSSRPAGWCAEGWPATELGGEAAESARSWVTHQLAAATTASRATTTRTSRRRRLGLGDDDAASARCVAEPAGTGPGSGRSNACVVSATSGVARNADSTSLSDIPSGSTYC